MRWTDYTPLFAIIIVILCMVIIAVLAVLKVEIPSFIVVAGSTALGAAFVSSSVRGTAPPGGEPPK